MDLPKVLVDEIMSYVPKCSKCKKIVWNKPRQESTKCKMCNHFFCYDCLNHITIRYYEGHFDICSHCIYINNYTLRSCF